MKKEIQALIASQEYFSYIYGIGSHFPMESNEQYSFFLLDAASFVFHVLVLL